MRASHLQNLLLHSGDEAPALFAKCTETKMTVGSEFQFFYGFKTGDDDRFLSRESERDSCVPFVRSADVTRFGSLYATGFVDYRPDTMRAHRSTARPGDRQRFERPKVIVARMGKRLITTFDSSGMFVKDAMLLLSATDDQNQLKMLTGLLNSRLLQYLYENHFATVDVLKNALLALPLPSPQYTSTDASMREKLVSLVNLMLDLGKRLSRAQTNYEKNTLNMQAGAIEKQLDKLVYNLFKFSESEITVVEGSES